MNKFTLTCYRSLHIALILIVLTAIQINSAGAQERYAEQPAFSEAELAQILAPIALYPDSLLTHILIASTYPLEVVQADRWRTQNRHLDANQLMEKAEDKNWDPSVTALLAFPNVLGRLSDDLTWTQKLGDAFLQDEAALLDTIQSLRQQADQADSLSEMENMSVTRVNNQIIIESAHNGVIYVPYYDPRVVYGHWHWYSYPPVYWAPSPYYVRRPHAHFYWNSGIQITFNYYFSSFNWHKHHITVVSHYNSHHYRHRERIITSHGAQPWHHKPQYRYRVTEDKFHVKQRDNSRLSSGMPSIEEPRNERQRPTDSKTDQNSLRSRLEKQNKQADKPQLPHTKSDLTTHGRVKNSPQEKTQQPQAKSEQRTHSAIKRYPQEKPVKSHQPSQVKGEQRAHSAIKRYPQEKPVKSQQPPQAKSEQRAHGAIKRYPQENDRQMRAPGNQDTRPQK